MERDKWIQVEVTYALPEQQYLIPVQIEVGGTVREAILTSGIIGLCPEIRLEQNKVGVFGRLLSLDSPLSQGDRVEIYRPLLIDPKQARRHRAAKKPRP